MSRKPNGVEQVRQYARLVNGDQKAPASAAWPEGLAGFRPGDAIMVPAGRHFIRGVITRIVDQALLEVETPSGKRFKCGWMTVRRV